MEELVNLMEETVLKKIDQLWELTDYCKCDNCRIDVAAYALNRLPAKYVHSTAGAVIHKFESTTTQTDAEITSVVFNAIQKIGENCHHEKQEKKAEPAAK